MHDQQKIIAWLQADTYRMQALLIASTLNLPDWCLGAGFIRNLVWDKCHQFEQPTPLNDLDLIYFNPNENHPSIDTALSQQLKRMFDAPWSVKNQARMHLRNHDAPYTSTQDAMAHWVEIETAVGARINAHRAIEIISPFGLTALFNQTITHNPKHQKVEQFLQRVQKKRWCQLWPKLSINY